MLVETTYSMQGQKLMLAESLQQPWPVDALAYKPLSLTNFVVSGYYCDV